ncbi:hypothetical protein [Candidatus Carsonella ruddii]|uniref:ATP phosphoribosyltransferase n=1 Tax=Carsonella ruddii TaxID=114186 RepID=A0AAE7G425_CARRU|nr:hypothetical protein [Candidatus Carsonella ruddii]AGS06544.1 ATP phosphoribosyltransferase [Candidatus Carsonella ruddii DC]ALA96802.1 hypothetical protein AMC76_00295 [Candidatus Carsonella ruddii]QLK14025.1 hypothetical protein FK493_00285 [Candidatus Carsonella ruddii]
MILISVPKGRNFFFSLNILKYIRIFIIKIIHRKVLLKTNRNNIYIVIIKNKDLLKLIKYKIFNLSIVGKDLIFKKKIKKIKLISFKTCLYINNNIYIITKYHNVLNYYKMHNFNLKIYSSLEFFLNFKKKGIIDITETNKTLYKNFLHPNNFIFKIDLFVIYTNIKKDILNNLTNYVKNQK